jgi:23S rRNA (uracil1939-C5)-methyltransferase
MRARLAIRGRLGSPKIGLFELGSHRVVHVPNCRVHHPLINKVAAIVRRSLADLRVSCYSDAAHQGLARYLQVVVERSSQSAQVVLVANCTTPERLAPCFELIRESLGAELHSLWFNAHDTRSNVILGADFRRWCGPASVIERFGGAGIHYPPGAFGQSNLEVAELIIDAVRTRIPAGSRIAEFYAGTGAIGLSVLDRVAAIFMNEASSPAIEGLEQGLAGLDPADRSKVTVVAGPAAAAASAARGADLVIVDPPRKGLDAELLAWLGTAPPQRLLYVSCGLESLLRDAAALTAGRTLRLADLVAFNMFPYTEHVETLACFEAA